MSFSSIDGTAERGARSEREDCVRIKPGRVPADRGGDDDRIPVLDDGIGVGYLRWAFPLAGPPRACRLTGRGKPGEDDRGSNGGSSVGAGRLTPPMADGPAGGSDSAAFFDGDESIAGGGSQDMTG